MEPTDELKHWMRDLNNGLLDFERAARRARALAQIDTGNPIHPPKGKAQRMIQVGEMALDYLAEALEPFAEIDNIVVLLDRLVWHEGQLILQIGHWTITVPEDCDDPRDLVKAFLIANGAKIERAYTRALLTELKFTSH